MNCPQCQHTPYVVGQPCPACGFNPPPEEVVQFANLHFLLNEIERWRDIPAWRKANMRVDYGRQLRQVEIALGLRPADFTPAEAAEMHRQLSQHNTLLDKLPLWQGQGWLDAATADRLRQHALGRQQTLQRHLEETIGLHLSPAEALAQNIANQQYLLELLELLGQDGHLTAEGQIAATAAVQAELARLENRTSPPTPALATGESPIDVHLLEEADTLKKRWRKSAVEQAPRPPREPWTWDKIWDSLLSERTLKAVLFLAVNLLFGGAVSIVVNEWQNFPPAAQAAFLVGFTAVFYALGWYVRQKMRLEGSGIALTAVASLLVPLDFYTFYISGGFPEGSWPTVWLVASAVCLVAYTATALALRAEFFGYFIALAATSLITAALNWGDVAWQWWQVPPVAFALLLQLSRQRLDERLEFLQRPFQHMALGLSAPTVGMGLLLALFGNFGADVALPIAIAWWLGTGVLFLTIPIYPYRVTVAAALIALPIAVALTQYWLFLLANIHWAWHGVGLAVVSGVYFWQGSRGAGGQGGFYSAIPIPQSPFTLQTIASLLVLLAATVSLGRLSATAVTHLFLVAVMALASGWRTRPRWLGWSGLFMATATAAAQAYRGTSIPELALPWATLSIVYALIALRLPPKWQAYRAVIVQAAVVTAGFALLPPLVLFDLRLLTYTLGHWVGLTAWLGYLVATRDWQLGETNIWNHPALWHALSAVPFPLWVLLLGREESADGRIIAQALTGWLIFALGLRLRRWAWHTHRPWQIATHFNTLLVCLLVGQGVYIWPTVLALLVTAALYYTLATAYRWSWWLSFGVGFTYWGVVYWLSGQARGHEAVELCILAGVALALTSAGGLAEGWRKTDHHWLKPFYRANHVASGIILGLMLLAVAIGWRTEQDFVWSAAVATLLSANTLIYTWFSGQQRWGHAAVWLFVLAGGLFLKVYSQGSGRSAWLAAVLAFAYVGGERLLHAAARRPSGKAPSNGPRLARRAWRLLRRPLLWGGWGVSLLAILGALGRNLLWLDGGPSRQLWSIASLATVTALYVCSAYWFKQVRWAWAATLVSTVAYALAVDWLFDHWELSSGYFRWELAPWFGVAWVVWAFALAAVVVALGEQKGGRGAKERRSRRDLHSAISLPQSPFLLPPLWGAHLVGILGLVVAMGSSFNNVAVAVTLTLLTLFYATAAGIDRRYGLGRSRMVFVASFIAFLATTAVADAVWPTGGDLAQGLGLLGLAIPALYLGRFLKRWDEEYAIPLYLLTHGALWFGLLATLASWQAGESQWIGVVAFLFGALFYGLATAVHGRAGWLNFSTALFGASILASLNWLNVPSDNWGLLFMAAVVGYLAIGRWLEDNWGWQEPTPPPFPRGNPLQWPVAAWEMATLWWPFPFYAAGLFGVGWAALLTLVTGEAGRMVWVLAGGTAVWVWSMYRFKWRLYLLAAGAWAQWAAVAFLLWLDWPNEVAPFGFVLAFVTLATAAFGLLIEYALQEGAPAQQDENGRWRLHGGGWSRMLYLLVAGDMFLWEMIALVPFADGNWHGGMTLIHALTIGLLATAWGWPLLMYATQLLGLLALWRWVGYGYWVFTGEAIATTFWAVATGVVGYGLSYLGRKLVHWPAQVAAWARPLQKGSWGLSLIALAATLAVLDGSRLSAEMLVLNLALIGLLYLAVAVAEQRPRLAHVALFLLLISWSIWLAVIQRQDEVQLYALPASAYLLAVGWVEWRYGFRPLAVLIDYTGFVLLLGSVFWQAFGVWGGLYALLMIGEGLVLVWLGSARRMRRHLYAGVAAVLLAIISQILEPLLNLNAFVLLLLGGSLVVLGIALERRLEAVRVLTKGFSHRLEDWD